MRVAVLGILALASPAAAQAQPPTNLDQPAYQAPARPWADVDQAERDLRCRDRIEQVRQAEGKPKLQQSPADPEKSMLMHAVDLSVDGCRVIVPVADPSDVRQEPRRGPAREIPAS